MLLVKTKKHVQRQMTHKQTKSSELKLNFIRSSNSRFESSSLTFVISQNSAT